MASWLILFARGVAAADQYGRVTFSDQPVPGATLTATRGDVARVVSPRVAVSVAPGTG